MAEDTANDLDRIIRGARRIGEKFDPPMTPSQAFYHLEKGHIKAWKMGRIWLTTLRHIKSAAVAEVA
jgi:hypothetical protein